MGVSRQAYERKEFGPLALKAVRRVMIERGWCLSFIKKQINRVKKIFARAGRQELVTLPVDQALKAVDALRKGRSEAREKPPVTPEFDEAVEKSLPCLMPTVAMMVRVQRL